MKELVYFRLKSPDLLGDFLLFLRATLIPVFQRAGCQRMQLYRATSSTPEPYLLELEFESESAHRAAMQRDGAREATQRFLEFAEDTTLITYELLCLDEEV